MVLLIYIFGCPLCHFVENSEFSHNLPFFEINDHIYDHFYLPLTIIVTFRSSGLTIPTKLLTISNEKTQYFDSCMYMFLQITTWFETIGYDLSLFSKQ